MKIFKPLLAAALAALSLTAAAQTYRDLSGTITLGGTSQQLDAANPTRGRIVISNPSTATEVLCVNVTSAASCSAAGSWLVPAGGTLVLDSKEAVNIVAATTGHVFTAKANVHDGFAMTGSSSGGGGAGGLTDAELRATPVPVSGTVAATISGAWDVRLQDGAGTDLTSATRGAEQALTVQIVDGSGAQVTTFGGSGGTASNFGSAVPAAGTAAGLSDGTNMVLPRAFDADSGAGVESVAGVSLRKAASGGSVEAGTAADPLRTDPTGTTTQPVSGPVTDAELRASAVPVSLASVPSHAVTNAGTFATQSAVTAASGSFSSGALASGSVASGAFASGALASGSVASGAMVDLGAIADAAATAGSTGTLSAKLRTVTAQLDTLNTSITGEAHDAPLTINPSPIGGYASAAAPSNVSTTGDVTYAWFQLNGAQVNEQSFAGVLASTGTGNSGTGVQRVAVITDQPAHALHGHGATGAAVPANAQQMGARTGANMEAVTQGATTVAINVSTATTTELVALSGSTQIRVTSASVISGGTGNITFVYGTGTNCGTGTTSITGAYPLVANAGLTLGAGLGPVIVVPSGQALCVTTSAAVQMSGHVTYAQY